MTISLRVTSVHVNPYIPTHNDEIFVGKEELLENAQLPFTQNIYISMKSSCHTLQS